ncbi:hypothetical protein [Bacteroides sp. GM023]|uniref:hypothetical protein n=1 Tax=Bacteroides sp. GM023 TaxID=2723058 RepID=UPI00168B5789|nr:hypothetical protein [Bacteroides sp. GM023]MBD3589410.1 hypothetical protein [Bacteroides sp. GM023]
MDIFADVRRLCYVVTKGFFELYNFKHSFGKDRRLVKKEMQKLPKEGIGRDLFIILNGPSLKRQDLLSLKGKDLMFVNRGFMHPLYKQLQPKYHVFVDPKLASGVWPLNWLEQIFEMCPDIRIILPVQWHNMDHFAKYKDDKRVFWLYWGIPCYINGVSSGCFSYAILQGFQNIFFTGFDANSCAFDMIKSSESHFYGADPELADMNSSQHISALYTTSLQLIDLQEFSKYCKKRKINIYNLTDGGLLDMFIRRDFNDPYNVEKEITIPKGVID